MRQLPLLISLLCLLVACTGKPQPAPVYTGAVSIVAPTEILVGQAFSVTVNAMAAQGTSVDLMILGSYGPRIYHTPVTEQVASFIITNADTQRAGMLFVQATVGATHASTTVLLRAGPAISPLMTMVGPRTVPADGRAFGMAAVVPADQFGNLVDDRTTVELQVQHADGKSTLRNLQTANGIAWARMSGGDSAGQIFVAGSAGSARGLEADFSATAGWPIAFTVMADQSTAPADGRRLLLLRTSRIQDRQGNAMPDGTLITFAVTMPNGTQQRIPAYTLDGIAEAPLQAASSSGSAQVIGTLLGVASPPLTITFGAGPAIGRITLTAQVERSLGVLIITAGPLVGPLGQLVADGTLVEFTVTDSAGRTQQITAPSNLGVAVAELPSSGLVAGAGQVVARAGAGQGQALFIMP